MNSDNILFGKYKGLTFRQVLDKDLSYCQYIASCPANQLTEKFQAFVLLEMPSKKKEMIKKQIEKLTLELQKS